ncbi:hypothetical protein ASPWEDRAFT_127527 [Aspergillus wentii DTO 134E9]|uniref:MoaB/Mog domain-containing protein n=1 Tax=Aspergillus wentii DTO 134E9 TaxID=1073089 RepID=A0A1L9RV23_ASPWE|nr:uncharacterized protein ASPWEDRAFT_127527 [Aspergillus wentii DTO 134E9]KAI9928683.1 hypothetical protein MW887_001900 [Aspergillus wentii]OJJ38770.1 hypothetical protein ASPWEDRAFT_127527 [Aspergillus wentii DTO 134E9]
MATPTSVIAERGVCPIRTAGCLIIGDEVLGGKIADTNSHFMARFCFELGIELMRIEVIRDNEGEIIEAVRRMSNAYDLVVTSGGIGPTHDDITFAAVAKAFDLDLMVHPVALERMKSWLQSLRPDTPVDEESPKFKALLREINIPVDSRRPLEEQAIFNLEDSYSPVPVVNGNIHMLPGVPSWYERLLDGLKPYILPRLDSEAGKIHRVLISTPLPESEVSLFLEGFAKRVEADDIKVGSYERTGYKNNTVTLVGRHLDQLERLVPEVEKGVNGRRVMTEGEDD